MTLLSKTYASYLDSTLKLARSIILKIDAQNDVLNDYLKAVGMTVSDDPTTWKYNLNLCGEYHPLDSMIQVVSFDDKTTIDLTKANLELHPRTHVRLMNGETDYIALRNQYPNLTILINGITNPLVMEDVVAARNWQILRYDSTLIQSNELSLICRIQDWIDTLAGRWFNQSFQLSDRLYVAAFLDLLYSQLPNAIMMIRLELSRTKEASEYHIWNYLAGKYGFDKYKPYLSTDQAVWLFRNIDRLKVNSGKREVLEELMDRIATPSNVDLFRLDFVLSDNDLIEYRQLVPKYSYSPYYDKAVSFASGDILTSDEVVDSLSSLTEFNAYTIDTDKAEAKNDGIGSLHNHLPTKVLKAEQGSSVVAKTEFILPSLINYWGYLSYLGMYDGVYTIIMPGNKALYLDAKEAFILWMYAGMRSLITDADWRTVSDNDHPAWANGVGDNVTFAENIRGNLRTLLADGTNHAFPKVVFDSVLPLTHNVDSLMAVVPDGMLARTVVRDIIDSRVSLRTVTEPNDLLNFVQSTVNQSAIDAYQLSNYVDGLEDVARDLDGGAGTVTSGAKFDGMRAVVSNVIEGCYRDVEADLAPGIMMDTWLYNLGVDYENITASEWQNLSLAIPEVLLNQKVVTDSLGDVKTAILDLLKSLSSYDVVYTIGSQDQVNYREIDWPSLQVSVDQTVNTESFQLDYGLQMVQGPAPTLEYIQIFPVDLGLEVLDTNPAEDMGLLDYGSELLFEDTPEYNVYIQVDGLNFFDTTI